MTATMHDTLEAETAIQIANLSKVFRGSHRDEAVRAVDDLTVSFATGQVHGLLGRNGAGKSTLMKLITAQLFASSGQVRVFGEPPLENPTVLSRTCFIQESQTYPDHLTPGQLFSVAAGLYPHWDSGYAQNLISQFDLPTNRRIKKLSRGQLSTVGIILGLASRAELTMFDEPYLGLDPVARVAFFDLLLADLGEHPRTVVLSTHHIDEAADLLENIVVLDHGRLLLADDAESLRAGAYTLSGRTSDVDDLTRGRPVIQRHSLGPVATATVHQPLTRADRAQAEQRGVEISPVSLQSLFIHLISDSDPGRAATNSGSTEAAAAHLAQESPDTSTHPNALNGGPR